MEKLSNSLFFQIDALSGVALSLQRIPHWPSMTARKSDTSKLDLQFPKHEYDNEPISLYWYARSARELPLLQYLAFYQTIEFYFPRYSQIEATRSLQTILKTPGFNPHRDADVVKLLMAIKSTAGKGFGNEQAQLRATIAECVQTAALRAFFDADEDMKRFFTSQDAKTVSSHKVPLGDKEADLRDAVASRIYDIRCKIVHTKSGASDTPGDVRLLLPFSKEASLLPYDIELIQCVARQVLIASSRELAR